MLSELGQLEVFTIDIGHPVQGDPYGHGIVYVDSKFEVAFSCKVGLLPRPVTEL